MAADQARNGPRVQFLTQRRPVSRNIILDFYHADAMKYLTDHLPVHLLLTCLQLTDWEFDTSINLSSTLRVDK